MEWLIGILSAVIAAIVSIVVALISFLANKNELKSEREKFERAMQREMTNRLYEKRLEVYHEAILITNGLRRTYLTEHHEELDEAHFKTILAKIDEWHGSKAFLLLSKRAANTLYALRRVLREKPAGEKYSLEQVDRITKAKTAFRIALRSDIQLLYEEELDNTRDE
jgi:CHASE1-domain containing sensor protein